MSKGRVIADRYRLKQRLGRGSFGVVWEADELLAGEPVATVAVKIFTAEVDRREIALLARLSHPSILAYRAVVEDDDEVCLVTELADGGDGAARLKAWPDGLPPNDVRQIVRAVAAALQHLHAEGWVHRDVKPANILFVRGAAKLGDVGTARALTGTARATSTASLAYAAPELFSGKMGPGMDVYALGCAVFEFLTGRLPFDGNPSELVNKHLFADIEFPTDMPPVFSAMIRGCTQKDPDQRWSLARVLTAMEPVAHADVQPAVAGAPAGVRAPAAGPPVAVAPPTPVAAPPRQAAPAGKQAPAAAPQPEAAAPAATPPPPARPPPPIPVAGAPTPIDPALRRHLRLHGDRWGDAAAWREFMRSAEGVAKEYGISERDLIRRAGQLAPEVTATAGDELALVGRVRAWVLGLGGPNWSAPAWAELLDQLAAADEAGLARVRDALLVRLYPPGPGATRILDFGGGVHHLLVYRPISQLHKPTTQIFEAIRSSGAVKPTEGVAGVWYSADPVTVREWSKLTGQGAPAGLDPNAPALAGRQLAAPLLTAAQQRFPVDELRWPRVFEYDGIKAKRNEVAAAAAQAAAATQPLSPTLARRGLPVPQRRPVTLGGLFAKTLGKAAVEMLKEMNEAWLSDNDGASLQPNENGKLAMNLVSPVPLAATAR